MNKENFRNSVNTIRSKNIREWGLPVTVATAGVLGKLTSVPLFDVPFLKSCYEQTCDWRYVGYSYAYKLAVPFIAGGLYSYFFPEYSQQFKQFAQNELRRIISSFETVTFTVPRCEGYVYSTDVNSFPAQYSFNHKVLRKI